jgi:hypothetical protein
VLKRTCVTTWLALLAAVLLWAAPALAQSFYGALLTVVKDDQGGVLPGVTVVVVNQSTGERREAVSTEDGSARFVNLVPGPYRIEAELTGFQRYVREGIEVNVQTTPRIEVTLALGSLSETLTVTGQSPLLQTQSASVATTVASRSVQELPLNGRNVLNLISLAPSVVPQGGADGSLTGKNVFAAGNYQIGGGTANQSASFFDGVTVQDTAYGNIVVLTPSPDSVEEFSVQTNSSSAEFGRFTGGVVNMASRSGSNSFRGSLFEFHRNRELNSNTFFGERAGLDKPPFTQNNFGGTLGGAIKRDRLFFFSSYEGYRNEEGILLRRTVPTAEMRAGDFSNFRNQTTGAVVPIYDPWTQCGINNPGTGAYNGDCGTVPNRLQFPGNQIPAGRISPIARSLLAFPIYADPTVPGLWRNNNYETNAQIGGNNDQLGFRSDYNVSQDVRLIGRYTRWESTNAPVDLYGNGQLNGDPYSPEHFITTQAMLAGTWTLNSTTVFDARVGFLRWDYDREPGNLGINLTQQFGFPTLPYGQISERSGIPGMETIPNIGVTNNNTINTGLLYADDRTYTFTPTLTKIAGDHTIKVGANLLRGEVNYFQNNNPGGTFTFTNAPTALDGTNPGNTGDGFAAFLLGIPTGGTYQASSYTYGRSHYQAYFAEDSWQVNDKLTLNLGLRWEIPGVFTERDDNLSTFNPDVVNPLLTGITNPVTGQPFLGAFELVNTPERPGRGMRKNPLDLVVPRLGFAYQLTPNTVIRGGGGKFIVPSTVRFPDGPTGHGINNRVNNIQTSADNNRTFFTDMSNPFPTGVQNHPGRSDVFQQALLGGGANQFIYDPDGYPGSANQWNVALQHQFGNGLSVEATYIGLAGNHLANTLNQNQLGLEHVNRAATDTSVCSLTNNVIIPFGAPGYASNQRDTCYGAYLRQQVANPLFGLSREGTMSTANVQRALLLLEFPQYTSANQPGYDGRSRYHALQLRTDKRFGAGSVISANYTFSRNMTNAETVTNWLESGAGNPTAGYQTNDLDKEYSLSGFDARHRLVLNYVLDLPFGPGRRFLGNTGGFVGGLVGGWSVNGVTTFQAGLPLAFSATPNLIGFGYNLRPNVVEGCDKTVDGSATDRLNQWFNTACYTVPNAAFVAADPSSDPRLRWALGNAERVDPDLRAHGVHNWNFAVSKQTRVAGRVNLTLRAEAFNLFNRVQFGPPNTQASTVATANFGQVTTQANQPRLIQIAARLAF